MPAGLVGRLRELRSIRQAEAAVAGTGFSPWVFPSATDPAKPLNDGWLRDRVWRPLLEKAEVRYIRVHDARHTYASLMLRRGVPHRLRVPATRALFHPGHCRTVRPFHPRC